MEYEWTEIRTAEDVTSEHIEEAADMREGQYGGTPLNWGEIIDKLEGGYEDWGSSIDSPAIRFLKRETNRVLRERG